MINKCLIILLLFNFQFSVFAQEKVDTIHIDTIHIDTIPLSKIAKVEFTERLRDTLKFDSLDSLLVQMKADCDRAAELTGFTRINLDQ